MKLGAVASDVLGKSGRAMLRALDRRRVRPGETAKLAEGRLRAKVSEIALALQGHFSGHCRLLVEHPLAHRDELERHGEELSGRIAERLRPLLDDARLRRLVAIPGVKRTRIENVIA